jgi:hypothetical protein
MANGAGMGASIGVWDETYAKLGSGGIHGEG